MMDPSNFHTDCALGVRVTVQGSIDNQTAEALADDLKRLVAAPWGSIDEAQGEETLVLDLSNVEFINSTGIGALLQCHRAAVEKQRKLMVLIHPNLTDIFEIAKLHSMFQVVIPHSPSRVFETEESGP